ncbi:2OG-Fe(II) oxygenase [Pseudomonas sp. NPDC089396]|uniref:2OG-Fe(II) oxygenase n=1 Tax=Pseudomonas sp. NPDC089396 TaxID=3364461 RepID=UPI003833CD00
MPRHCRSLDQFKALDWSEMRRSLDGSGYAIIPSIITPDQCRELAALYVDQQHFRSRIVMKRHGFGSGEYQYFDYPLPPLISFLRHSLYPQLAAIANDWSERLGDPVRYPMMLAPFLERCHQAKQTRATPLLLQYQAGDYNCLHQDLYGEHLFPLQAAVLLSVPDVDFGGGEFVMTEYSSSSHRAEVVPLQQGDAVIFGVQSRPVAGRRGKSRKVFMRHGVSRITAGLRHTVGIIFHDSK